MAGRPQLRDFSQPLTLLKIKESSNNSLRAPRLIRLLYFRVPFNHYSRSLEEIAGREAAQILRQVVDGHMPKEGEQPH
jgi:hypothetical protein